MTWLEDFLDKLCAKKCDYDRYVKSINYWRSEYRAARKRADDRLKEIENLTKQVDELNNQNAQIEDELHQCNLDKQTCKDELTQLKNELTNLYTKPIPKQIRPPDKKDYVYSPQTFILMPNYEIRFKEQSYKNFYLGVNGATVKMLYEAGIIKWDGTPAKDYTPKELFDAITEYVQKNFIYVRDRNMYFFEDAFVGSPFTYAVGKRGDCEDLNMTIVNMFNTYEYLFGAFKNATAVLALGYVKRHNQAFGHAYALLITEDNFFVGEGTGRVGKSRSVYDLMEQGLTYTAEWGIHMLPNIHRPQGDFVVKEKYRWWENSNKNVAGKLEDHKEKLEVIKEGWNGKKISKNKKTD